MRKFTRVPRIDRKRTARAQDLARLHPAGYQAGGDAVSSIDALIADGRVEDVQEVIDEAMNS